MGIKSISSSEVPIAELKRRWEVLASSMAVNSILFCYAGITQYRNKDCEYKFRATSDFLYLTGLNAPDSIFSLSKTEKNHFETTLFLLPKNKDLEQWHGKRLSLEAACKQIGVNSAYEIDKWQENLTELVKTTNVVYYPFSQASFFSDAVFKSIKECQKNQRQNARSPSQIVDSEALIHPLRVIKSDWEIEQIKIAAEIGIKAHKKAMEKCYEARFEYEVQAELEHTFTSMSSLPAFNSIVASGKNSCTLHYVSNSDEIDKSKLCLIDAGAEFNGYASDITNTFPISGKFSDEQKVLYNLVLEAHCQAIKAVAPNKDIALPYERACLIICKGLFDLGIINKAMLEERLSLLDIEMPIREAALQRSHELAPYLEYKVYTRFFMHGIGHWLGLDVHDVGLKINADEKKTQVFLPNMVTTIEPGIYIQEDDNLVEPKWRGIGIRIEDDILVTATGNLNLTAKLPRTVDELENYFIKHRKIKHKES